MYGFQRECSLAGGLRIFIKETDITTFYMQRGGTEQHHSEVAARSRNIFGPYEYAGNKSDPDTQTFGKKCGDYLCRTLRSD